MIASAGIGNLIQNVIFSGPMAGCNSGVENLVPQAKGIGNLKLAGIYLNKGRVIITVLGIVLYIFCIFSIETLLLFLQQDPEVCKMTQEYIIYFAPSLYFYYMADLQRKFLNSIGKNVFPMIAFILTSIIYPFLCFHLAITLDMKMKGMALCSITMNFSTLVIMLMMSYCDPETR
jgi:Na+-driven multidrug efflux pump